MRKFNRINMAGLILGFMLTLMTGAVGSVTFSSADVSVANCPGDVTIEASGVVKCPSTGGTTLLSACTGEIIIDSTGVIRCSTTGVLVKPVCTLSAAPSTIAPNASSTLTASCSPAANSYTWTGGSCAGKTANTCTVTLTSTTTYSVTGSNAAGASNSATATVTVTSSAPPPPTPTPTCSLYQSFQTVPPGQIRLATSCSFAPTSYSWSSNTGFGSTDSGGLLASPTATTDYAVTGYNSSGVGYSSTLRITVSNYCNLSASASSIGLGGSSILTASCSPAPTGYVWPTGVCAENSPTTTCTVTPAETASYTMTGTGAATSNSVTVTVVPPSCTLTATPSTIGLGATSTLTAACSPTATGYNWNGAVCQAESPAGTCIVTPATVGTPAYTVTGTGNNTATSNSATVTVVQPFCTLTAAPSSIVLGATSTLTAACSPAAMGYNWNGAACQGASPAGTCVVTPSEVGTSAYTVTGTENNTATSNSATVTVTAPVADPGCPNGYSYSVVPITWPANVSISGPLHTMSHCEVKAFQFTMPSRLASQSQTSYADVPKYLSLSQTAFDFSPALEASGCAGAGDNNPIIWNSTQRTDMCSVVEGATYYLNVRNASSYNGPDNCPAGSSCTFYLAW